MFTSPGLTSVQLACVLACLRRAYTRQTTEWAAPRLVGTELIACADHVAIDGVVGLGRVADPCERVLHATRIQLQRDHLSYRLSRALEVYFYFILVNESYLSYQLPPRINDSA